MVLNKNKVTRYFAFALPSFVFLLSSLYFLFLYVNRRSSKTFKILLENNWRIPLIKSLKLKPLNKFNNTH